MPQNPVLVEEKETGELVYMHSIDASEALRLGDYVMPDPSETDPQKRANALNRMRSMNVTPPPELQTPAERAETRRKANEEAQATREGRAPEEPLGVRQALGATPPAATTHSPAPPPQEAHAQTPPVTPPSPTTPSAGRRGSGG